MAKKPVKRQLVKRVHLPSFSMPSKKVPGKLKSNQHLFKFKGKNFVVEKWGFKDKNVNFIGIQKLSGMEPIGGFIATASYSPLKEKVPGLNLKAWEIGTELHGITLKDANNSVEKRLVKMIQVKAGDAGVKALVAKSFDSKTSRKLWESLGFKKVDGTSFFVKRL